MDRNEQQGPSTGPLHISRRRRARGEAIEFYKAEFGARS